MPLSSGMSPLSSFDALKHALMKKPLLHPPNYAKDYILYLASSTSTISMVLLQEDEHDTEHVIYYLSKTISGPELRYSHVEKLALETFIFVQIFFHYILLHTTMIITNLKPMYHILNRQVLGGKYSKWIIILQEFDLKFAKSKVKKLLVFVELICDLPHTDEDTDPMIPFMKIPCSLLVCLILGMDIFFSISKTNAFSLSFHMMNDIASDTTQNDTLSFATPYTTMELILSYDIA
jgi:hypothetical protein